MSNSKEPQVSPHRTPSVMPPSPAANQEPVAFMHCIHASSIDEQVLDAATVPPDVMAAAMKAMSESQAAARLSAASATFNAEDVKVTCMCAF
jgi:hypothetical protein